MFPRNTDGRSQPIQTPQPQPTFYRELRQKPVDPNRAKLYGIGLSFGAALFAVMTFRSNLDYFDQYYTGWAYWIRVIPFFSVEAGIILLPLTKGWGNRRQMYAALACEAVLVVLSLAHTNFVGESIQTRKDAERTKTAAAVDLKTLQDTIAAISDQNNKAQDGYNKAQDGYNKASRGYGDTAWTARAYGRRVPNAPEAPGRPNYAAVPEIDPKLLANATMSIEQAVEANVPHKLLLRLLYGMVFVVVASITLLVWLADASRVKAWLLKFREAEIDQATARGAIPVYAMNQAPAAGQAGQTIRTAAMSPPATAQNRSNLGNP